MKKLSDKQHAARIKTCLDDLWELTLAARKAGLSVNMHVTEQDDEDVKEIPRVDAWLSRTYEA